MNKGGSMSNQFSPGDVSPELVPVVEPGALGLILPQQTEAPANELDLGDLLSDALFGEVIDISDLIPRLLSPSHETAAFVPPPVEAMTVQEFGLSDSAGTLAAQGHTAALTILYDEDVLAANIVL
jgi:hypothetical protein